MTRLAAVQLKPFLVPLVIFTGWTALSDDTATAEIAAGARFGSRASIATAGEATAIASPMAPNESTIRMWKLLPKNTPPMAHVFNRIFTYVGWQAKRKVSFILARGCDL
jgi:hypothetical protein